jgi:hypothetical protein
MNTGNFPTNTFSLTGMSNCLLTAEYAASQFVLRKSYSRSSQSVKMMKCGVCTSIHLSSMSSPTALATFRATSIALASCSGVDFTYFCVVGSPRFPGSFACVVGLAFPSPRRIASPRSFTRGSSFTAVATACFACSVISHCIASSPSPSQSDAL